MYQCRIFFLAEADTICVGKENMKLKVEVIPGMKFGRLTAVREARKEQHGHSEWIFRCDCGNEKAINRYSVVSGRTRSCGCLNMENRIAGNNRRKHGMTGTRIHRIWKAMKARCNAPDSSKNHRWYQGVKVCSEWSDFLPFYHWAIENGYREELSIDRIDPYGNYEPSNCRWATAKEQANNKKGQVKEP